MSTDPIYAGSSRLDHLAELHRGGRFDPEAGPASAALAQQIAAHALRGTADPTAGIGQTFGAPSVLPYGPQPEGGAPMADPSGMVTVPDQNLGSQAPGASFLDQWAVGMQGQDLPGPSGYQSNGAQFLTALLGSALKSASTAHLSDLNDRRKTADVLSARTADMNRRNLDATEKTRESRLDLAGRKSLQQNAADLDAKGKAAAAKADAKVVSRQLANALGDPSLAGQPFPSDIHGRFVETVARIREDNAKQAAAREGMNKFESAQMKSLDVRQGQVSRKQDRALALMGSVTATKEARAAAGKEYERLGKVLDGFDEERATIYSGVAARQPGAPVAKPAPAAGATTAAPAAAAAPARLPNLMGGPSLAPLPVKPTTADSTAAANLISQPIDWNPIAPLPPGQPPYSVVPMKGWKKMSAGGYVKYVHPSGVAAMLGAGAVEVP